MTEALRHKIYLLLNDALSALPEREPGEDEMTAVDEVAGHIDEAIDWLGRCTLDG